MGDRKAARLAKAYAWLTVPFLLNDFANIFLTDFGTWLAVDYLAVKALPLGALWIMHRRGALDWSDLGLGRMSVGRFLFWAALLSVAGVFLDQVGWRLAKELLPGSPLGRIPLDTGSVFYVFDLTVGLALVAVVEEVLYRGLAWRALRGLGLGPIPAVALAALVFGAIHWSLGPAAVLATGVIGAVFMVGMLASGSAWPCIAAHFVVNFVDFSGLF